MGLMALICGIILILYGTGVVDNIIYIISKPQKNIVLHNCTETDDLIEDYEMFGLVEKNDE